jgi:tetratricopeptide (TPR) repeat protein
MPDAIGSAAGAQRAAALFQHGNEAALKSNFDYAVAMYREACKLQPENLVYRQALRGAARRKFGNDPKRVGRLAGARVQPIHLRARAEKGKGNWERVLDICEEAFLVNPWDVGAARDASEAAGHLGRHDLACWLIESVYAQAESDQDYLRHAAHVYEQAGQFAKAIACWERVRKLNPYDELAKRQINALSASATIVRSGLGEAIDKQDPREVPADPMLASLDDLKVRTETPETRLRREIAEEPARVGPYLELADLLRQQNKLDDAEKVLAAGRKAAPGDELLRAAHAEVQMARLRRAVAHLEKKARLDPDDPEVAGKLAALREKLDAYELHELRHRAKVQPADAQARLVLGACLARLGRHDEAIAEFQQVRGLGSAEQKLDALRRAGGSFEAKGLPKLAERSYQDALKLADGDDLPTLNDLHYRLGRVAEAQGNLSEAEEHYNEVAANDYTYLDVAERLRALNQGRQAR